MNATPHFVTMHGDSMAPTVADGDLVGVLPVPAYRDAGLYVVEVLGIATVVRAWVDGFGRLIVGRDNPTYCSAAVWGFDVFAGCVLGKVFAVCKITDRAVMEDADICAGCFRRASLELKETAA